MNNTTVKHQNNLLLYIILIFCFEPRLFVKYEVINWIYIIGAVVSFVVMIGKYYRRREPVSAMLALVVLYRLSFFFQTLSVGGDITMWGYFSIILMTFCMTTTYYMKRNVLNYLRCVTNVLALMLTINLVTTFLFPEGIVDNLYFIGIRTRFTDVIFPLITISLVCDYLAHKRIGMKSVYIIAVSLLTISRAWIATAIVGCLVYIVSLWLFTKLSKRVKLRALLTVIVVTGCVVNLLVLSGVLTKMAAWFIEDVLHKSLTLSGRTEIWEIAIDIVLKKPLFGYGMFENGGFVYWGYKGGELSYWQAHNQWLQIMHDGGLLMTGLFIGIIFLGLGQLKKIASPKVKGIFLAAIAAFMVMMITEIYAYTPYLYLLFFVAYNADAMSAVLKKDELCYENRADCRLQQ